MNLSTSHIKDPTFKKIARKIVSEMKRLQVPGVAIGIWHGGKEYTEVLASPVWSIRFP
jgi:hypothetical protein